MANELVEKYLNAISEVYGKTHTLWEVYSPDMYIPATNASGIHMVQPDFVGWTGLAPISMLIENVLGIRLNAPEKKIEAYYAKIHTRVEKYSLLGLDD